MERIKKSYNGDTNYTNIIQQVEEGSGLSRFCFTDWTLKHKGRIGVGNDVELQKDILKLFHDSAMRGHSGLNATSQRVLTLLYWKGMENYTKEFIRHCEVCQHNKVDNAASPGLLQPLPMPHVVFTDILMNFITSLPKS